MILLWGAGSDPQLAAARAAIEKMRRGVVLVDQEKPAEAVVDVMVGDRVAGSIKVGKKKVDHASLSAAFVRVRDPRVAPAVRAAGEGSALWHHALALDEALQAWTEVGGANVIHARAVAGAQRSKPRQARTVAELGFRVPASLVTTDPAAARAFHERHREVVYKSLSGARSRVARLTPAKLGRLDLIRNCPTQFQERVAGVDHRVHVFGNDVFACALEHDEDDSRTALADKRVKLREVKLDAADEDRCRKLVAGLGLQVAGIDLRRAPEGDWICFAVEPTPAFTRYDSAAPRMAESLARLLVVGDRTQDRRNA